MKTLTLELDDQDLARLYELRRILVQEDQDRHSGMPLEQVAVHAMYRAVGQKRPAPSK